MIEIPQDLIFSRICGFQGTLVWLFLYQPSGCTACHASRSLVNFFLFFNLAAAYSPTLCAVPSAARVLTVVFGMGTGVSPGRIAARNA